uniref:hypothetical protein n=1 Tax=Neisseria sicca TaxID=490 RepID=UPI001C9A2B3F
AGLGFAYVRGNRREEFGGRVEDGVVDNGGMGEFGEEVGEGGGRFGEDVEIEGVEVVFVLKEKVKGREGVGDFGGEVGEFE